MVITFFATSLTLAVRTFVFAEMYDRRLTLDTIQKILKHTLRLKIASIPLWRIESLIITYFLCTSVEVVYGNKLTNLSVLNNCLLIGKSRHIGV